MTNNGTMNKLCAIVNTQSKRASNSTRTSVWVRCVEVTDEHNEEEYSEGDCSQSEAPYNDTVPLGGTDDRI